MAEDYTLEAPLERGLLAADGGLRRAIVISLFTDARAGADDELPAGSAGLNARRGWWGDIVSPAQAPTGASWITGSRLWLLSREKQTAETARRARGYAEEALQWLIAGGWAATVSVDASWAADATGVLVLTISITLADGTSVTEIFRRPL
ncbi:phage GP46 family protein [Nitratidesulfovibrio sp. HK-II]|uniref:phage GP46 family protein n=1 Tax=Nitratidesulfovibrio sp. HK-II TaxID=2009266 RepID=UPI003A7888BB